MKIVVLFRWNCPYAAEGSRFKHGWGGKRCFSRVITVVFYPKDTFPYINFACLSMFYLKRALLLNLRSKTFCHAVNRAVVFDCLFEKSLQTNKTTCKLTCCVSFLSLIQVLFSFVFEYGNEIETKENKIWTRIKLSDNIHVSSPVIIIS